MEQFGKYTLVRKIGTGGMAEVYLARTTVAQGLSKILVIKKIHTAFATSRQFVSMFVDEAKIALGLNHPNVIQVFDFGAVGDTYFLAMEFVDGVDVLKVLQECAQQRRRVPYGVSAYIVQQVAKGLDYAHRKSDEFGERLDIVHRDISPQNVLVSWDGGVKVVDFGIARARDVHEDEGVIKGKFSYMSPEQARGEPVDCRSDVFAAGIVLFEMICARPLFPGKGKEPLDLVKSGVIPRPRDFAPKLPDSMDRIILKALAFNREDRYATARDLQHDLTRFQLEWAQSTGELVDSAALAQFLASAIPQEKRTPVRLPSEPLPGADAMRAPTALQAVDVSGPVASARNDAAATPVQQSDRNANHDDADSVVLGSLGQLIEAPVARITETRERKYVYVLEGTIRGLPALERRLGHAGARSLLDEFMRVARDIAFKYDATVERKHPGVPEGATPVPDLSSGDLRVRVVVGLPVASEDDASRAIRLALALVDALDGIGSDVEPELRLAVGVQRGVALVSRRSGTSGAPFVVEDATTDFAARLASQARGAEILVGGRVFRAARSEWNFEPLPAIELPIAPPSASSESGASIPADDETDPGVRRARVYRLRGAKARAQRLSDHVRAEGRLYGRDLELKQMRDAYRDVLVRRSKRQIVVVGDAGVGKRALVTAFLATVPPGEALVVRATTSVATALTPYSVIADLARDVLGLAEDAEPGEVERRMLRALPLLFPGQEQSREARAALEVFGLLLGARGVSALNEHDAEERRQVIRHLVLRFEQQLSPERPLILICEDVHWADQESQDLFTSLLKRPSPRPILGILTARPEARGVRGARELGVEIVNLDELPVDARRQLVIDRFIPGQDVTELVDQIVGRAGGNPFFIREILDALIERGVVVVEGATEVGAEPGHSGLLRWAVRDVEIHVPSSVEDALATRIDRLPPGEKQTMMVAAVLGRNFSSGAVSSLLGRPARLDLDDLAARGLLTLLGGPVGDEYAFKNEMAMTVAYGLLGADVRVRLHRDAATRIASASAYRPGQDDAVIARHLELAGDDASAADRYLRAAHHAVDVGGNADAFRQLSRALRLLPDTDHVRRFAAMQQRQEILRRLARRPQQLREIHALRREAEALGDPAKLAIAHSTMAQFYIDVGKAPAAARAVAPAMQYARESGDKLAQAEALGLRAVIARLVGNNDESLRLVEQALTLCEQADAQAGASGPVRRTDTGDSRRASPILLSRATLLFGRGATQFSIGSLEHSIESYAEALVIYRALALPRLEARALSHMGTVFSALGEYEEALAHYKSALKLDQQLGDRASVAQKLGHIGSCYVALGDLSRAENYLGKALTIAEQTGDLAAAADAATSLGQARLQAGQFDDALATLERGLRFATDNRERYQEIRALEYIALAQLLAGHPAEGALELARSATELARKMPMPVGVLYGLVMEGLALSRMGRHDEAFASTSEAITILRAQSRAEGVENVLRWHADVARAAGRVADADAANLERSQIIAAQSARLRDEALRDSYVRSRGVAV